MLRGFISEESRGKNKERLFVYIKKTFYPANINDVFCENGFYNIGPGGLSADDSISQVEYEIAQTIRSLRTGVIECDINKCIPKALIHLSIRTKHLRDVIIASLDSMIERKLDDRYFRSREFEEEIIETAINSGQSPYHARAIARLTLKRPIAELRAMFQSTYASAKAIIPTEHSKVLRQVPLPNRRISEYESFRYQLVHDDDWELILGDCVTLNWSKKSGYYGVIADSDLELDGVFLPLTPKLLLIGHSGIFPEINHREINEAIARCSSEKFVSAIHSNDNIILSKKIGTSMCPNDISLS